MSVTDLHDLLHWACPARAQSLDSGQPMECGYSGQPCTSDDIEDEEVDEMDGQFEDVDSLSASFSSVPAGEFARSAHGLDRFSDALDQSQSSM